MDKRPFADPSDESKMILEYDHYVKSTVKAGGTPLTPDAWIAIRNPIPLVQNVPVSKPVEHVESDKRIQDSFASIMISQGFGSRAERMRAELQQWYDLNRQVNRVFNKLLDAEMRRRRAQNGVNL